MKALSVHGGGEESERISDNVGGCTPVVEVGVDEVDSQAVLVGREVAIVWWLPSQSARTEHGRRGDSFLEEDLEQAGDSRLNLTLVILPRALSDPGTKYGEGASRVRGRAASDRFGCTVDCLETHALS